jgi:hypothetical protein
MQFLGLGKQATSEGFDQRSTLEAIARRYQLSGAHWALSRSELVTNRVEHPMRTLGRVCLWPNRFFLGDHFEARANR